MVDPSQTLHSMIDAKQKRSILNSILASEGFVHSPKNQKLLTYLVESSIKDEIPRETDIASDVFDRRSDFDSSGDTIVRVSMHNLRSKLERYYETEGKDDPVKMIIDKGHYRVSFIKDGPADASVPSRSISWYYYVIFALLGVIIFLSYKLVSFERTVNHSTVKLGTSALWSEVVHSDRKKLIVLGDEFFFSQTAGSDQSVIRKHFVNTFPEFDAYVQGQIDTFVFAKTPYLYFPKMVIWPIPSILKLFKPRTTIEFQGSSLLQSSNLLSNDIIFIGSFRSLYLFNDIFKDIAFKYHWTSDYQDLVVTNSDSSIVLTFEGEPGIHHTDYCYLRKFPGPSGNTIIMIFSAFHSGMSGVMEIITDDKKLHTLEQAMHQSIGYRPQYFNILFETTGHSRTALKTVPIEFEPFKQDASLW
ncbi:hypothetical protein GF406_21750 [candidate division KSB1 bacterium]|nr:hypothetical protein [candidate division KSB1 bacterium]